MIAIRRQVKATVRGADVAESCSPALARISSYNTSGYTQIVFIQLNL